MAAGQGFKTFTTGEVLTAGDVNGYLMQGILVFASEAARNAAITSPQEGQFAFTKDTNSTWYYDGAAWVASGASGDVTGVTAGTGITVTDPTGPVPTVTNSMATAIDAKGDLVAGTGADAFSRLAVGANDTILTADSTAATGLKWAAASAATQNYALINSGGTALTGSGTTTISFSGKNQLFIKITAASAVGTFVVLNIRFNSDTAANYGYIGFEDSAGTFGMAIATADTSLSMGQGGSSASNDMYANISVSGANGTGYKPITCASIGSGSTSVERISQAWYAGTSAITSVSIISSGQNFDAGTVFVYGA